MKTIKLKKDGLHHYLVMNYTFYEREPSNICEAISATIKGLFTVAILIVVCSILLSGFVDMILWIYIWNTIAFVAPGPAAIIIMLLSAVLGIGLIWKVASDYIKRTAYLEGEAHSNSFVVEAYRSVKDKYCAKVEYE